MCRSRNNMAMNRSFWSKIKPLFDPALGIRIIWKNRDLLEQLVRRNIHAKYRGSLFGILWSFILPLLMLAVYTFVFTVIFQSRWGGEENSRSAYAIIMLCGLATFNIFSESLGTCCGEITKQQNYVKKVVFPLEILPISRVFSSLVLGLAWFVLLFIAVVLAKGTVYWTMLLLPLPILAVVLLSLGVGLFMASIGVYIRDIQQCVAVIIRVLFFITPIFYPINAVPPGFRFIIRFNPLAYIIEETRKVFWYGMTPNWTIMLTTIAACALCAHLGLVWFIKTKKGFADVI